MSLISVKAMTDCYASFLLAVRSADYSAFSRLSSIPIEKEKFADFCSSMRNLYPDLSEIVVFNFVSFDPQVCFYFLVPSKNRFGLIVFDFNVSNLVISRVVLRDFTNTDNLNKKIRDDPFLIV
ncbi:MAG: hypothetical protein ACP5N9_03885 [Candidatus Bilamarchaeum sp.]|jgi:hypothetical protein